MEERLSCTSSLTVSNSIITGGWGEECSLDSITSFDDLVDSNDSDCRIL